MSTQLHEPQERGAEFGEQGVAPTASAEVRPPGFHVEVNGISRHVAVRGRAEITVLDDVSFAVAAGELVAIVGPSGAGKTMVLEAISGLAPIASGSVLFDGMDLHAN